MIQVAGGSSMGDRLMFSQRKFREVLGNYPTGVAVITAIDSDGGPVAMVVGTFTSVSLEPPLVGFLPAKSSTSFPRIRSARSFCVNVLSADQEKACRQFAISGGDKFTGIAWSPAPSGAPCIEGAAAWIDCTFNSISEAGDHYFVTGQIVDMETSGDRLPLVFFQGGYGRFSASTLVAEPEPDLLAYLHHADAAHSEMEQLSAVLNVECVAVAPVADELVVVASSGNPRPGRRRWQVGQRSPFIPPLGAVFVGARGSVSANEWMERAGTGVDERLRAQLSDILERIAQRGWSVSLTNDLRTEIQGTLDALSHGARSPEQLDRIRHSAIQTVDLFDPPVLADDVKYPVRLIAAPIQDRHGHVVLALTLWGLPETMTGADIKSHASLVAKAAGRVSQSLTAASP
jgi:flavin reductase (DIM6/NTAB) family NADH-FMN oxidoreductase RutF/DNA-binding IclR family transcriptional regulator